MQFLIDNIGQILGYTLGAGGVGMAILERRKNNAITKSVEADAESKEIGNGQQVVSLYKDALDDLSERYEKKYQEITSLYERKIKVLEDEIRVHKRMLTTLKKENSELRKHIKNLESQI
ncbi:hypothetical protein [Tenacibaculum piscium]|uniref:hypothetical protein n=1 Tax=Tenacibaculum piscium TaxID=1458515 RepID=UPI001F294DDC|nr:hypothetical protein [Tenacibaculum piscium]